MFGSCWLCIFQFLVLFFFTRFVCPGVWGAIQLRSANEVKQHLQLKSAKRTQGSLCLSLPARQGFYCAQPWWRFDVGIQIARPLCSTKARVSMDMVFRLRQIHPVAHFLLQSVNLLEPWAPNLQGLLWESPTVTTKMQTQKQSGSRCHAALGMRLVNHWWALAGRMIWQVGWSCCKFALGSCPRKKLLPTQTYSRTSNLGCRYFFLLIVKFHAQAALAASGRTIETAPKPPPGALHPSLPQINRFESKNPSQSTKQPRYS